MKLVLLASKALPSSAIDLHPQPADIDFIAAKTRSAIASGNGARTGIDQIVANDPRAVASAILQLMGIASAFRLPPSLCELRRTQSLHPSCALLWLGIRWLAVKL
jgi:hypothetical protein